MGMEGAQIGCMEVHLWGQGRSVGGPQKGRTLLPKFVLEGAGAGGAAQEGSTPSTPHSQNPTPRNPTASRCSPSALQAQLLGVN